MPVLVVNAGSATLKFRSVDAHDDIVTGHDVDPWDGEGSTVDLHRFLADRPPVDAVGHRVVHGGTRLREATLVTAEVEAAIAALVPLAPLHQDRAMSALAARSEEHTSELQSLMRISYAVFCLKKKQTETYAHTSPRDNCQKSML